MSKNRDSFIFYRSFYQSSKKLSKQDKSEIFDAICSYALDGEITELSIVPEALFTVIKPQLDANRRRWVNGCKEKKTEAKPKQKISKTEAKDKQKISKTEANVNVNVNDNDNLNDKENDKRKTKVFQKPTLEEIKNYCQERKSSVDAIKFFDYYETGEWKDAKGDKVRNWKQKLLTWESKQTNNNSNAPNLNADDRLIKSLEIITKSTLIDKISVSSSNKAVLHFKSKKEFEELGKIEKSKRDEIKKIISESLKTTDFEFKF